MPGPIFERELLTTPRRPLHYVLRAAYVGLLFVLLWTAWQAWIGFQIVWRVGDLAHFNTLLLPLFAYTQLTLVIFGAALYGTTSVSHEKDRRTFVLLLVTRLRDSEIVLDKFLCGLLQLSAIVFSGLPVFALCMLLGGSGGPQVLSILAISLGSATVACSVGVLVALWRERTFQSIAMTLLAATLSLTAVEVIVLLATGIHAVPATIEYWAACVSPYRAVAFALQSTAASDGFGWYQPPWMHVGLAVVIAALALAVSTWKLRAWNPRGEPIQRPDADDHEQTDGKTVANRHSDRGRQTRTVSDRPILWREIATRAYGAKPVMIKIAYLTFVVLLASYLLTSLSASAPRIHLAIALTLLPATVLSLLLVNAQAVSAITAERDLRGLDLLLVTDITAAEFIFGKLAGIAYNTKEMIIAPLLLLLLCVGRGLIGLDALALSAISVVVFFGFAAVLGLHAGLRYPSTRQALAHSLGTMFLLFVGILICLYLILVSGRFEAQWISFILFIVLGSIGLWISLSANAPSNAIGLTATITPFATFYCVIAFVVGDRTAPFLVSTGVYGFATLALLVPMVSEFDVATGRTTADEGL